MWQRRLKSKPGRPLTESWYDRWNRLHGTALTRADAEQMSREVTAMVRGWKSEGQAMHAGDWWRRWNDLTGGSLTREQAVAMNKRARDLQGGPRSTSRSKSKSVVTGDSK
jgi:hypothetical protein